MCSRTGGASTNRPPERHHIIVDRITRFILSKKFPLSLISGINGDILYSLLDSADGFFSIDEHTGVISLERPLDREVQSTYQLKAMASDLGTPRHTTLCPVVVSVLDINDNPPVFEHREYTATVSEDEIGRAHV